MIADIVWVGIITTNLRCQGLVERSAIGHCSMKKSP